MEKNEHLETHTRMAAAADELLLAKPSTWCTIRSAVSALNRPLHHH